MTAGVFTDARILRVCRQDQGTNDGPEPFAAWYQNVGEKITYGVNWTDWLANYWKPETFAPANQVIRPSSSNGYQFTCSQAGLTGAQEPAWPAIIGGIVNDGSVVWTCAAADNSSLSATLSGTPAWSPPSGIAVTSAALTDQTTTALVDSTGATSGTDYDVLVTATMSDSQIKIARLRIKVR
jgi:hypothetical protein